MSRFPTTFGKPGAVQGTKSRASLTYIFLNVTRTPLTL